MNYLIYFLLSFGIYPYYDYFYYNYNLNSNGNLLNDLNQNNYSGFLPNYLTNFLRLEL